VFRVEVDDSGRHVLVLSFPPAPLEPCQMCAGWHRTGCCSRFRVRVGFRVDSTEQDAVEGAGRQRGQAAVRLARSLIMLCGQHYSKRLAPRLTAGAFV
jgi:hypothetical protein